MSKYFSYLVLCCFSILLIIFFSILLDRERVLGSDGAVHLTTTIVNATSIALDVSPDSLDFGSLLPGDETRGSGGLDLDVTTNSALGYSLGVNDNVAGSGSALLNTDGTTRISDFSGSISNPVAWNNNVSHGLGLTVYAANTGKEAKWGTGNVYDDSNNTYAGITEAIEEIHNVGGPMNGSDHTFVGLVLGVPLGQKPGDYSGEITFTATANFF
jgi:hypothetical protein